MRFILSVIFLFTLAITTFAQSTFNVDFDQRVSGDNLLVDIYMNKTSGDDFELGGCNLPFNIHSAGLDLAELTIVDSLVGKFSTKQNPASYSGPSINKSNSFTHIYFSRNYAGGGLGKKLTGAKEKIVTVSIPITDPCSNSQISWVNKGTLTNFSNKRIKKNAQFIDSEVFEFTQPLADPVIFENNGVLESDAIGDKQWYLNGELIAGATASVLTIEKEGTYTLETSNGCLSKTSNEYTHHVTGPELVVSAAPNPFVNQTTINYNLPSDGQVSIEVFDAIGNKISTLVNATQSKGIYSIPYSTQQNGSTSGVYFVKLRLGEETRTQRIVELINN